MRCRKINFKVLLICLVIVYITAFIGSIFTSKNASSEWYQSIKPSLTPPNWVFPIAWTLLYLLIIASGVIFLKNGGTIRSPGFLYYCIAWILNLSWSPLFFRFSRPDLSFAVIVGMLLFIALTISTFYHVNRLSGHLLVPYFIWVSFAAYLNAYIVFMN